MAGTAWGAGTSSRQASHRPHRWLGLLDSLVPPGIVALGGDALRRGRLTLAATLISAASVGGNATAVALLGQQGLSQRMNGALLASLLALPLLLRRTRSVATLAGFVVALGIGQLLLLWWSSGGENVTALFAFAVIPLCATLLGGRRAGVLFTGVSCGVILLPVSLGVIDDNAAGLVRDAIALTLGVGAFSSLYDGIREGAVREARALAGRAEQVSMREAALSRISRRLRVGHDFEAEVQRAVRTGVELAGANGGSLTIFDAHSPRVIGRYLRGSLTTATPLVIGAPQEVARNHAWTIRRVRLGEVANVLTRELPAEAAYEAQGLQRSHIKAWLMVPVHAGPGTLGIFSFERRDREERWSEEEVAYLRLLGETIATAVVQQRSEADLRESEEKFARAFASLPEGVALVSPGDYRLIECNEAFAKLASSSRQELLGQRIEALGLGLGEADQGRFRELLRTADASAEAEFPSAEADGPVRTLVASVAAADVGDQPTSLLTLRDVSEHRALEDQLRQSQKMEAVGRLAGGVAHDFNNMLTVIGGYAEALRDGLSGEQREAAEQILESTRRSADLTRHLLAFSRRQVLRLQPLDSNQLVRSAESLLRRLLGEDIEIVLELDPDAGWLQADASQLEQVLVNLAINARDAMPQGGTLRVITRPARLSDRAAQQRELAPGPYVSISVVDDGAGMDESTASHVLEPFFTTKGEGEGTGLGLSMAHGVVLQCGGSLTLESELDRGTRVEILLPGAAAPLSREEAREADAPREKRKLSHTILLVEDEGLVRRLARSVLERAGHRVVEAQDGVAALEAARSHNGPIDLLLTDLVMPRMGGLELSRHLIREHPGLRIAFMSGYPLRHGGELLPDDALLIAKPFKAAELRDHIATALNEPGGRCGT